MSSSRRNGSVSRAAETASKSRLHMDRNPGHTRITDPANPAGRRKEIDNVMKRARQGSPGTWDRKLIEVEEKDPNRDDRRKAMYPLPRWRHSGYKQMYLDGSKSPSPRRSRSPPPGRRGSRSPLPGRRVTRSPLPGRRTSRSPLPGRRVSRSPLPGRRVSRSPLPGRRVSRSPLPGRKMARSPLPRRSRSPVAGRAGRRSPSPRRPRRSRSPRRQPSPASRAVGRSGLTRARAPAPAPGPGATRRAAPRPAPPARAPRPPSPPPKSSGSGSSVSSCSDESCSVCSAKNKKTGPPPKGKPRTSPPSPPSRAVVQPTRELLKARDQGKRSREEKVLEWQRSQLGVPPGPMPVHPAQVKREGQQREAGGQREGQRAPSTAAVHAALAETDSDSTRSDITPTRMTLSERFGKMAQWSQDRGARLENMRITRRDAALHVAIQQQDNPDKPEGMEPAPIGSYPTELLSAAPTDTPAWDDVRVRYQYYKQRGYLRGLTLGDYVKWEEWWYKYQEWLKRERAYERWAEGEVGGSVRRERRRRGGRHRRS